MEAACPGITVIPPGYFRISNINGCPKVDAVNVRLDCLRNSSTKDDLSTLMDTGTIATFIGSERTPNTTSVQFDAPNWCMDKIATCGQLAGFSLIFHFVGQKNDKVYNGRTLKLYLCIWDTYFPIDIIF